MSKRKLIRVFIYPFYLIIILIYNLDNQVLYSDKFLKPTNFKDFINEN